MKILLVSKSFKPNIGGIETVVEQLGEALSQQGIEARILTQAKSFHKNAVKANAASTFFKIKQIKPDIIHIHGFRTISLPVMSAAKILKIPAIITPHFDYNENFKNKLNIFLHKRFEFKKIIALTSFEKQKLELLGFKNIEVIPNFFDFSQLDVKSNDFRKTFQIPEDAFLFLFVGRLAANKGIQYLIEAFSRLDFEKKFLAIVGSQDKRFKDTTFEYFNSLIEKFGAKEKAILTGRINDQMLAQAFHASNAVVVPSISSEAFGLVILQAMYCSKPVIATNLEVFREIVSDKEDGILVEPKNAESLAQAMKKLALNPELCNKMGQKAKEKAINQYSKQKTVNRLIDLYKSFI